MDTRLTYRTNNHSEWLLAITLAFGLCIYTGYTGSVEFCQTQPEQIEWVLSGKDSAISDTRSYHQVFKPELSQKPVKRSREYEAHVKAVHQSRINVALEFILEQSASYPLPAFHQQTITVLHSGEESSSHISG